MICNHTTKIPHHDEIATQCRKLRQLYGLPKVSGGYDLGNLGGRNCATVWYELNGELKFVTCSSEAMQSPSLGYAMHSEKACFDEIEGEINEGAKVVQVYTERIPCGPDNQNCFNFLHEKIGQDVKVYWSFEWPDTSDFTKKRKRDDPIEYNNAAKRAKKERKQGTKMCIDAGKAVLQPGPWGTAYV